MLRRNSVVAVAFLAVCSSLASGAIIQVGPTRTYKTVQAGVNAAVAGDTIQIDSGTYVQGNDWASIGKANLTIIGMGTRPILDANGSVLSSKGIFVVGSGGTNLTVQNLEFKNARFAADKNGAGIRFQSTNLTVRGCYFHDNDDGVLTDAGTTSTILIETSEFNHNGHGDGQSHNMYIGNIGSFTLRYCWSHNAYKGQEVKSRAQVNYILYNRLGDEGGAGDYEIDISNGGTSYVIGNQINQGPSATNGGMITYAAEGGSNPDQHLYVVNNTLVNTRSAGTFVNNSSTTSALLENNIFQGVGTVLSGLGTQTTNWATSNAYLADPANYDYHLTVNSTGAINMGTTPGTGINGFNMNPTYQYVHPCSYQTRTPIGTIDIGSYEY